MFAKVERFAKRSHACLRSSRHVGLRLQNNMEEETQKRGKTLQGVVVKTAMKDTATVLVDRYVKHPKYKKYLSRSKKYLVHDVGNTAKVGDKVVIRETRPISRRKHFVLLNIEKVSTQTNAAPTDAL